MLAPEDLAALRRAAELRLADAEPSGTGLPQAQQFRASQAYQHDRRRLLTDAA